MVNFKKMVELAQENYLEAEKFCKLVEVSLKWSKRHGDDEEVAKLEALLEKATKVRDEAFDAYMTLWKRL